MNHDSRTADSDGDEDDIDLGAVAGAITRRWKTLVIATLVVVAAATAVSLALERSMPVYQAQATVLLTGAKYRLTLDPKFTTVDNSQVAMNRADEYQAIALSREVAQAAGEAVAAKTGSPVLGAVDVRIAGNVVTITASARDPAVAVETANAYGAAAAQRFDSLYGVAEQDQAALAKRLAEAVAEHAAAEARLGEFTRTDTHDSLSREIAQKQLVRDTIVQQQNEVLRDQLASYYAASLEVDRLKRDTGALRRQIVESGASSASTLSQALALVGIESRLINLGSNSGLGSNSDLGSNSGRNVPGGTDGHNNEPQARPIQPAQLQLNADALITQRSDRALLLRDVDAALAAIDLRREDVRADYLKSMQELSQQAGRNQGGLVAPGYRMQQGDELAQHLVVQLTAEIQELQAQERAQTFQREVLLQAVEQAKTARATLESKVQEASIAAAAGGGRAFVLGSAVAPSARSFPPPLTRTVPVAALLGLALGLATIGVRALRTRWSSEIASPPPAAGHVGRNRPAAVSD